MAPGYTYFGDILTEEEQGSLVLWRPIFDGLSDGVSSQARTSKSGVGCLVQRGSILALRAILLRHGHAFSAAQLQAILREAILPAIQAAAEGEQSHILQITSENPSMSNIDFLVDPFPLPPSTEDPSLLKLTEMSETLERLVGPAELMLEASFTDVSQRTTV